MLQSWLLRGTTTFPGMFCLIPVVRRQWLLCEQQMLGSGVAVRLTARERSWRGCLPSPTEL